MVGTVLKILGVIFIIVVLVGGGAVGAIYFLSPKTNNPVTPAKPIINQINDQVVQIQKKNLLSGQVKLINQDLGLVTLSEDEKLNNYSAKVFYYEAGKFESGDLTGYTRVVLIREATTPSGPARLIFATKDFKTYTVDTNDANADGQFLSLDKTKVTSTKKIPSEHPQVISLDSHFSLNRNAILSVSNPTGQKDKYGNSLTEEVLQTNLQALSPLKSTGELLFYASSQPKFLIGSTPNKDIYRSGYTSVVVADSTGLAYSYDLTNNTDVNTFQAKYEQAQKEMQDYIDKKIKDYPVFPQRPSLRFRSNEISVSGSSYSDYEIAIPSACAFDVNTWVVKNVKDTDFRRLGTSPDGDIFALTDSNHELLKMEYQAKVGGTPDDQWQYTQNPPKPAYQDYVSKNPLLFFKDYWGRWVAVGEYDFKLMGGCGKPVLYLYPEKETMVSVHFLSRMQLTTTIPDYNNGWNILARPDGTLSELGQRTDCSGIVLKFGSEYAKDACENNSYPYLYWAGNSLERPYPQPNDGWIVSGGDLGKFMGEKLDEVGLNSREKTDMMGYWLPKMREFNSPYFRISFLQTKEMNEIAPMLILPQPQSLYRLFLDFSPLAQKPSEEITPQNLEKIQRRGFTIVEWGGKLLQ